MEGDGERPAPVTLRQRIVQRLTDAELTFEELRRELALPVGRLEEELRHVERSLRGGRRGRQESQGRLLAEDPHCLECGFVFRDRAPARFSTPGRCPRCRSERIAQPRLRIG